MNAVKPGCRLLGLLLLAVALFVQKASSAQQLNGLVLDAETRRPLAFVNIIAAFPSGASASTDIDGRFSIRCAPGTELSFSYVGYKALRESVSDAQQTFYLVPSAFDLSEVEVVAGENPAHRIIRLATDNRDRHDPRQISSYSCLTYSKTVYDIIPKLQNDSVRMDSLRKDLGPFADSSHVLLIESVNERKYLRPGHLNEKVIATRVSGFKNPSFSTSATDLQPFSFYGDHFNILNKDYLNPISPGSTTKYFFQLQDTIYEGSDTVYLIYFRPSKGKKFDGLEGVLYINTNGYAIQNVIASPYDKGLMEVKIRQQYQLLHGGQWFPEQLHYELEYKNFPSPEMGMRLSGKGYIKDVVLDLPLRKKDFSFETVSIVPGAERKDSLFWRSARPDSLNDKELRTYVVMDSVGKELKLDRTLKIMETLTTFQFPVGFVNLDIARFLSFNDYENVRAGAGLHTNDRLSSWFSIGGYVGYGFRDSVMKYGGDLRLFLRRDKEAFLRYSYSSDLAEPARAQYFLTKNNINRNIITSRMDYALQHEVGLGFRAFKYLTGTVALNSSFRKPHYNYIYRPDPGDSTFSANGIRSTEVRFRGRYAYQEKLIRTLGQLISDGSRFPILYFAYSHAFPWEGVSDVSFDRASIAIEKSFLVRGLGRSNFFVEGGLVSGTVPYPFLFNGNGAYTKGGYLLVENSFQTMGMYEFVSDRYCNIFFSHNFGTLFIKTPRFQPQFIIHTSAAYGSLSGSRNHHMLPASSMEKGFYESGLVINNLVRSKYAELIYIGLGGGVFMRYGPYAKPDLQDNLAYRLNLTMSF